MTYTEKEVKSVLNNEIKDLKIENLYKSKCVNWSGKTKDTKFYSTEIIAAELKKDLFKNIDEIKRKESYCRDNHDGVINKQSNRYEENFAKQIKGMTLGELGYILDYQVPLKDERKNTAGKIDNISYNEKKEILYLIELKYGNNTETLLRAILEIYTYYKIVNNKKLINDFFSNKKLPFNNEVDTNKIIVKPAVLLTSKCRANKELSEISENKRPKLKKLISNLGVSCFTGEFESKINLINLKQSKI